MEAVTVEETRQRGILRALALNHFVGTFGFAMSFPFLAIYCHKVLGVSIAETGAAFGALGLIRAASQYVSGELSDRIRPDALMIGSLVARSISFGLITFAIYAGTGFYSVIAFLFLATVTGSLHQIASQAAVASMIPDAGKLRAYALTRAAGNLGFAAGPALGGFLVPVSYVLPFALTAGFLLASVIPVLKLPRTVMRTFNTEDSAPLVRGFWLYLSALFLLACVMAQIITPLSLFVVGIKHVSEAGLGGLYTLNGLLVVALQVIITRRLSVYSHQAVLICGSCVYFAAYSLLGFGSHYIWFFLCMILVTLGEIVVAPPTLAHAEKVAPPGKAGRYLGLAGVAISLGWFAGPLYGSYLLETIPSEAAWMLNASPALLAAILFAFNRMKEKRHSLASASEPSNIRSA